VLTAASRRRRARGRADGNEWAASACGRSRGVDIPAPRRPFCDGKRVDADNSERAASARGRANGGEWAASMRGRADGNERTASACGRSRGVDIPAPRRPFRDGERVDADDGERAASAHRRTRLGERAASSQGRADGERAWCGRRTAALHPIECYGLAVFFTEETTNGGASSRRVLRLDCFFTEEKTIVMRC